jgi:hypothetical protein
LIGRIVFSISLPLLILSGLTAYVISSWLLVLLRLLGATRFSPRLYWACTLFGSSRGVAMFGGRVARALGMTLLVPALYAVVFELMGRAELVQGAVLGSAHGVLVGAFLPLVARRNACSSAAAPGLFGWRLGHATPLLLLLVYALYGAALGYAYVVITP